MTKSELIKALAAAQGVTAKEAEIAVKTTFQSTGKALCDLERIEIRGFDTFKVKDYSGHDGRNPTTREKISVSPKKGCKSRVFISDLRLPRERKISHLIRSWTM